MKRFAQRRPRRRTVFRYLSNENGMVFMVAVLAVGVIFSLTTAVSSLGAGEARATPYWRDKSEAVYVAESGLNHTMWKLKYEGTEIAAAEGEYGVDPPTFTSDSADESLGVLPALSSYQVWVKTDPANNAFRLVTILAYVGDQSHILRARLQQESTPFFDENGDGTAEEDEGTQTTISFPNLPNLGILHVTAGQVVTLQPGEYLYEEVRVDGHGVLQIAGDVTLWVRSRVNCSGDSVTNPIPVGATSPDHNLVIYIPPLTSEDGVTSQSVTISGDAEFNGFIYAPNARCRITGNSDVYGMVVGDDVTVTGATNFDPSGQNIGWPASASVEYLISTYGG